jgi:hypothetical protein
MHYVLVTHAVEPPLRGENLIFGINEELIFGIKRIISRCEMARN